MTFGYLAPIVATDDMAGSVQFYTQVLGFTCGMESADYSNLYRDTVRIMLSAPGTQRPWTGASFTGQLYVHLDTPAAVDALWQQIGGRAEAVYAPEDFSYGMREFAIYDPNGYHLSFGARIESAPLEPC